MKRIIALLLALILCFAMLVSCGDDLFGYGSTINRILRDYRNFGRHQCCAKPNKGLFQMVWRCISGSDSHDGTGDAYYSKCTALLSCFYLFRCAGGITDCLDITAGIGL